MNSAQRARRRERREARRLAAKRSKLEGCDDADAVFSTRALVDASIECEKTVRWKSQAQGFALTRVLRAAELSDELRAGTYVKKPPVRFTLCERGTKRDISGVRFRDRVPQRALCERSLIPVLQNSCVYDNGASMKGKGTDFARRRFILHMRKAWKRWGDGACMVAYDFRRFFASVPSDRAMDEIRDAYRKVCGRADAVLAATEAFVCEEGGLGLGNQTSQTVAVWYPSSIDAHIREVLRCGLAGRYMDDGYTFFPDRASAEKALESIREKAAGIGLELHRRKSKVISITEPIVFLKTVHRIGENGRVRTSLPAASFSMTMRHLRSVARIVDSGRADSGTLANAIASARGKVARGSRKQKRRFEREVVKMAEEHGIDAGKALVKCR